MPVRAFADAMRSQFSNTQLERTHSSDLNIGASNHSEIEMTNKPTVQLLDTSTTNFNRSVTPLDNTANSFYSRSITPLGDTSVNESPSKPRDPEVESHNMPLHFRQPDLKDTNPVPTTPDHVPLPKINDI